jgi:hypothetical protein
MKRVATSPPLSKTGSAVPPSKSWMSIFALMPAGWAGGAKRPFDRELLDCVAAHFTAG